MPRQQLILTVGREFGSGGREIAQKLAEHYNLDLYDNNLLKEVLNKKDTQNKKFEKYDETQRRIGVYRTVRGMDSSPENIIATMQFDFLKKKAESGESFVVVGRCAETILKKYPGVICIFILGDKEEKLKRVMKLHELSSDEAEKLIKEKDKKRKKYHNSYCEVKWGDSRNYDICINSSKLGVDETVEFLIDYIDKRSKGNA